MSAIYRDSFLWLGRHGPLTDLGTEPKSSPDFYGRGDNRSPSFGPNRFGICKECERPLGALRSTSGIKFFVEHPTRATECGL